VKFLNSVPENGNAEAINDSGYLSMTPHSECNASAFMISPPANYDVSMSQASQEKSPNCYARAGPSCSFSTSPLALPFADNEMDIFSQETIKMESP
jgi:hypothetical protein